jgi:putative phage-type endonuclease
MDRTRGMGGSDIAALMGISPWNTAYGVYLDKIGETQAVDKKHFRIGHKAQSPILRRYEEETDSIIEAEEVEVIHPDYPFLIGHLDALTNGGKTVVEVKTTRYGMDDWDHVIPPYYKTQVGFYTMLANADYADMAVSYWFDYNDEDNIEIKYFTILTYWRDEAFEQGILDLAVDFWENHVLKRRPPELRTLEDIKKRYAISLDSSVTASDEIKAKLIQLELVQQRQKTLEAQADELKFFIQNWMGESAVLTDEEGKRLASFKSHHKNTFDSTKFKEDHSELYNQYLKQTTCRPFKVA